MLYAVIDTDGNKSAYNTLAAAGRNFLELPIEKRDCVLGANGENVTTLARYVANQR